MIRQEYPGAKIIPASPRFSPQFFKGYLEEGLGPTINAIAWHPWYQADPEDRGFRDYAGNVRALKQMAESYGFRGEYMATEWSWFAPYPPSSTDSLRVSEMQKAKYAARLTVTHVGLDVTSFWNETFQTHLADRDVSLLRNTFSADPISPAQPQPVYYVLRTLSTVLEDVAPASLDVVFSRDAADIECFTFKRGTGEILLALWIGGRAGDDAAQHVVTDVSVNDMVFKRAAGFDVLNGTRQELQVTQEGAHTTLRGLVIRDWPLVLALSAEK